MGSLFAERYSLMPGLSLSYALPCQKTETDFPGQTVGMSTHAEGLSQMNFSLQKHLTSCFIRRRLSVSGGSHMYGKLSIPPERAVLGHALPKRPYQTQNVQLQRQVEEQEDRCIESTQYCVREACLQLQEAGSV